MALILTSTVSASSPLSRRSPAALTGILSSASPGHRRRGRQGRRSLRDGSRPDGHGQKEEEEGYLASASTSTHLLTSPSAGTTSSAAGPPSLTSTTSAGLGGGAVTVPGRSAASPSDAVSGRRASLWWSRSRLAPTVTGSEVIHWVRLPTTVWTAWAAQWTSSWSKDKQKDLSQRQRPIILSAQVNW